MQWKYHLISGTMASIKKTKDKYLGGGGVKETLAHCILAVP